MVTAAFIGILFVVASTSLILGCYALMRRLAGPQAEDHTKDLASSVIFRVSALHGLIIALVFAQEMADFQDIRAESAIEVAAIADVYNDAARYGEAARTAIQGPIVGYLEIVVSEEWDRLGTEGVLDPAAWAAWEQAYEAVLDLDAATARETSLRDHMLSRIHEIADQRENRAAAARGIVDMMFWVAAVSGVVLMSFGYYTFPPTRHNLTLLCLFGVYTGIILFFIFAFSDPYSPPGEIAPDQFRQLLADIEAEARTPD